MMELWLMAFMMGMTNSAMLGPNWDTALDAMEEFPYSVMFAIFKMLDGKSLYAAALVCRRWRDLIYCHRELRERVRKEIASGTVFNVGE